jgi:hypothetical protein
VRLRRYLVTEMVTEADGNDWFRPESDPPR